MIYYEDTVSNSRGFAAGAGAWIRGLGYKMDPISQLDVQRMRTITMDIVNHFTERKYRGKIYTDFEHFLEWKTSILLDGDISLLVNKYLKISSITVTLDSFVTFFIDGTLEINGNVNIVSDYYSQINLWHNGKIKLKSGSTLTIGENVLLDIEDNGDVIFEDNSKLVINGAVYCL